MLISDCQIGKTSQLCNVCYVLLTPITKIDFKHDIILSIYKCIHGAHIVSFDNEVDGLKLLSNELWIGLPL